MNSSILIVIAMSLAVAALARRYEVAPPLALVLVGLGVSWIPGLPITTLDPDLVLYVILPPLLYSAAQDSSYLALRRNIRAVSLLAVALPLISTLAVGLVAYWCLPQLPLAAAMALGAIVAPPDAVSATAIGRRLGLPRRMTTLLGGESLLNDATALTAYRLALGAVIGATTTVWGGLWLFAVAAIGGALVGLVTAAVVAKIRAWLDDPPMETAVGIVIPFVTYVLAEEFHASGVIAVVVVGLVLGQKSTRQGYATRLQDNAVWRSIDVLLESFVFLLIGLQLPTVLDGLHGRPVATMVWTTAAVLATVIVVRIVWMYPATYLPRMISRRIRDREPAPRPAAVFIVAWSGMRGVVSLAAAFAIPLTTDGGAPFPARDEIIFLTFAVVVGTLLIQGTSLPWLIRRLGVRGDERRGDLVGLAAAQDKAGRAALQRLDEMAQTLPPGDAMGEQVAALARWIRSRQNLAWEKLGRSEDEVGESPTAAYTRMRTELLRVQREVFITERDAGRIDDEVLRRVLRQLDLAEGLYDRSSRLGT
ncbi:Na+/H+ antiporter [Williamsia sp. CHRR-6]|uniref:Na+/H+ antiporter n=1 Tax=Williamsia sp. CHRR-6 TaxID=2835871 RepID=UPI001BD9EA43|nr:Na+/H+ antiporter [Williamsia sp. CHRR-6]MBT0566179.1 Na+/H+ antiporter [Williamsia sp. CHRR-6]